eukprot:8995163-Ditylum_brightwellii.AAC.1
MRIAKDFLREAIQLVATKRPLIAFKIDEGVVDRKLGESRIYKLCTQSEKDNSPMYSLTVEVKQAWRYSNDRGCHYCKYHGYCNHMMDECRITINQHKGSMYHKREDRFLESKKVHFSSGKVKSQEFSFNGNKDLHSIINEKIAVAISHHETKDLNKFGALSILSGSSNGNNSNSNSMVSDTSNEGMYLE